MYINRLEKKPALKICGEKNKQYTKYYLLTRSINRDLYKNPKNFIIKRAFSSNELFQAYKLVHDRYVQRKYLDPDPMGVRIRPYELSRNTATFIAKKHNKVIGVSSLVVDSKLIGLPSEKVFNKEIKELRRYSVLLSEVTNQAIEENSDNSVITELIRCLFAQVVYKGCDKLLITVNKSHKRFYELNYFRQKGDIKNYSEDLYTPVILMYADMIKVVNLFNNTNKNDDPVDVFMTKFYNKKNPYLNYVKRWEKYRDIQINNTNKLIKRLQNISRTENEKKILLHTKHLN